ncbi:leucyl aminopeptidase [Paenibacillus agri]|uniref:Probable cytosol aminopeptidase n=1 Tax=Paenibacillus agri TaxID=2744309 RepID=A0A850EMN6_9BACL|nr:leucyl aminopeptidase [Paenibacillus agri]NUU60624.1 leucyl aminopeptidase [Paenibacillus agri]
MNIEWSSGRLTDSAQADALVLMISESEAQHGGVSAEWDRWLHGLNKAGLFEGKVNQSYALPLEDHPACSSAILTGVGAGPLNKSDLRLWAAQLVRTAIRLKMQHVILQLPQDFAQRTAGLSDMEAAQALSEGFILGAYRRKHYKLDQSQFGIDHLLIHQEGEVEEERADGWREGLERGQAFGEGTNLARDLTNTPGNLLVPSDLAVAAIAVAERYGFPAEVLDEQEIARKGMGGLIAVGKGSVNPPRMIVIRYQGTGTWENVIGLVGKGITFDTGGISLKRAPGMEDMISDMGGAAAVLGVMEALGRLRPPINVVMAIPSAENMPAGNAFKPGDIVTSYSGRTIEVLNTDAEGRIVLADALTYIREWGAERIVDVATLTGAVLSTLGDIATGAVTNNEALLEEIMAAGESAGEKIWQLPAYPEFRDMLKSEVADIRGSAGRYGGATTAGLFIGTFAEGLPWVHLDIAGTAFLARERGVNPKGASGVMVRTLLEWLLSQALLPKAGATE